jgi:arsenical pump membrane protein
LAQAVGTSVAAGSFVVGLVSILAANLLNNQPATIFLTRVLDDAAFRNATTVEVHRASLFALALASNYGANMTLIGALAGLMWRQILIDKGVSPVGYFEFARIGFIVTLPMVLVAFGLLAAVA